MIFSAIISGLWRAACPLSPAEGVAWAPWLTPAIHGGGEAGSIEIGEGFDRPLEEARQGSWGLPR